MIFLENFLSVHESYCFQLERNDSMLLSLLFLLKLETLTEWLWTSNVYIYDAFIHDEQILSPSPVLLHPRKHILHYNFILCGVFKSTWKLRMDH